MHSARAGEMAELEQQVRRKQKQMGSEAKEVARAQQRVHAAALQAREGAVQAEATRRLEEGGRRARRY